jgi:hypothetical protein
MQKVFIVPSDGWRPSFYPSSRADFTTGVSIVSTSAEATFTTAASATTVIISSNRNTASRCLNGQTGRAPSEGVQRVLYAKTLTPAFGALQRPDAGNQDPSGLVVPVPA